MNTNTFVRVKAMTTVIGIKCKDGIVLASDSRGTSEEFKTEEKKIFNISNTSIGIGAAGNADSIRDFINNINIENKFHTERSLREELYRNATEFKKLTMATNPVDTVINDINIYSPIVFFALVGAKLKDEKYCLYQIQLNDHNSPSINVIDDCYWYIGSGKNLARLVLNQQNRINNLGELDINTTIGVALYVIDEVKRIDPNTDDNTQIAVIDENGYRDNISPDLQLKCYESMINNISDSIDNNLSNNEKIKMALKNMFPVSKKIFL